MNCRLNIIHIILLKFFFIVSFAFSCNLESMPNLEITSNGMGDLSLYEKIEVKMKLESIDSFNMNNKFTIGCISNNDTLFYANKIGKRGSILEITTTSSKMKYNNIIHVGMSINELSKFYPNIRKSIRKIPLMNIVYGGYVPNETKIWRNVALAYQGIVLNLNEIEKNELKDTILTSITIKSNLLK